MTTHSIVDRLRAGETLLLDGGTGSELQRRGADVLKEAEDRVKAWSATANIEYADVVRQVHSDYLRVGADIIISNNFWTTPTRLDRIGERDNWREYAAAAIRNAVQARDAMRPEAYVAGGIAAPGLQEGLRPGHEAVSDSQQLGVEAYRKEWADHAKLLADEGADVIFAEFMAFIDDCVVAVDGCAEAGLPIFLGVRNLKSDGAMSFGETLADLAHALDGCPVEGVMLMCSNPESISAGLPILRDAFAGPVGAYANLGYNPTGPRANRPTLSNQKPSAGEDIFQNAEYYPSRMAQFAGEWKGMGAQIIGGCCASGPEHISAMRSVVKNGQGSQFSRN